MSDDMRGNIYNSLKLKDTEELLAIWIDNNRKEWSNEAFQVVEELLRKRNIELPMQEEPGRKNEENGEMENDLDEFTQEEIKIIEDENPPEFYDPMEVLITSRYLKWAAWAMIVFYAISQLLRYETIKKTVDAYFVGEVFQSLAFRLFETGVVWIAFLSLLAVNCLFVYFLLTGLSHILRILMQMEFNSRMDK
jgi:hypothetical protein